MRLASFVLIIVAAHVGVTTDFSGNIQYIRLHYNKTLSGTLYDEAKIKEHSDTNMPIRLVNKNLLLLIFALSLICADVDNDRIC